MLVQTGNLTRNGHGSSLKMVMTMMLMSVTSLLVIFPSSQFLFAELYYWNMNFNSNQTMLSCILIGILHND